MFTIKMLVWQPIPESVNVHNSMFTTKSSPLNILQLIVHNSKYKIESFCIPRNLDYFQVIYGFLWLFVILLWPPLWSYGGTHTLDLLLSFGAPPPYPIT